MRVLSYFIALGLTFCVPFQVGCVVAPMRPCTEGGQAVHESGHSFKGKKRCFQVLNSSQQYVNHGKYYEWFPNEKISVVGQFEMGKKVGRWREYDEEGKTISDRYFEAGREVPAP